jgi:hypothetical protein
MSLVLTCLDLIEHHSSVLVNFFEIVAYWKTPYMCLEQQVAMFLHTVGHNIRNRVVATNFDRSGETASRYFNKVLHAVGEI